MDNDLNQTGSINGTNNPQTVTEVRNTNNTSDFQPSTSTGTDQVIEGTLKVVDNGQKITGQKSSTSEPLMGMVIGFISLIVVIIMLARWVLEAPKTEQNTETTEKPSKTKAVKPKKKPSRAQRKHSR
jgi:hypothetical protein